MISPSRMITPDQVELSFEVLTEWGLNVVKSSSLFHQDGYFGGTDEERLTELQSFLDDPSIKAIFCARGGYGMTRIVDDLDFTKFMEHPKWIVGFSDITALHLALDKVGFESIHGLMPVQFSYSGVEESLASLRALLFEERTEYLISPNDHNIEGEVSAKIIGGNLSLLAESLGTNTEINTDGKILFIEEIDEYLYKVDRMLMQLKRSGKFNNLAGVMLGDFSDMKDTQIPFGKNFYELVLRYFNHVPVCFQFPAGHEPHHLALPIGRVVHLNVNTDSVKLVC
ncbi:S66 peptidase family protein [Fulvivirga ligni]|uniref:S66 peptidase family protein n=1 Tax=Fulvivirga ligni TaxID=2904246 RepID=UPI001F3B9D6E|nr:LD-carboxypeptidase [Fulvivirga ligni]UII22764.1 LD-carboxypeptidase [Fulvivirga ligni]